MHRNFRTALHEARDRLAAYTDRLWEGREIAPPSLFGVYTERLACAARMAAMLHSPRPQPSALVDLHRREDRAFPRDLLATDAGREARSAFNALGRAIRSLEDYARPDGRLPSEPASVVGERLSAVSFVLDYLQLDFDGLHFTVLCPAEVRTPDGTTKSGENGFRDRLCELIGSKVGALAIDERSTTIEFEGGCSVRLDLAAGPSVEKLIFNDGAGMGRVWT
jgi:hypothetical protein